MPVFSTSRYSQAQVAMIMAQALLNDPQGNLWVATTAPAAGQRSLIQYLNMALGDLRTLLGNNGVQVRVTTQINLPLNVAGPLAGQTNIEISDISLPQLPTDCIQPLKMWEQPTGSGQLFVPMRREDQLPNLAPSGTLNFWQWQDDQINLIGATQPTTIQLEYESRIPQIVQPTDLVLIPFANETLAKGCAAYASFSDAGKTPDTDGMFALFQSGMDRIVIRYTKAAQFKPRRRKPYGRRERIVYL